MHKSHTQTTIHSYTHTRAHTGTYLGGMTSDLTELLIHPNDCPTTWIHQVADCATIMTSASEHPISTAAPTLPPCVAVHEARSFYTFFFIVVVFCKLEIRPVIMCDLLCILTLAN